MLKQQLSFFLFLTFVCSCNVGKTAQSGKELFFELQFKGRFDTDTISLAINGCPVVKNRILVNDKQGNLTDLQLQAYPYKGDHFRMFCKGAVVECRDTTGTIAVSISFNNAVIDYKMDLRYGKYIGFSKISKTELSFRQSDKSIF